MLSYEGLKRLSIALGFVIVALIAANILVDNGTIPTPKGSDDGDVAVVVEPGLSVPAGDAVETANWKYQVSEVEMLSVVRTDPNGAEAAAEGVWVVVRMDMENKSRAVQQLTLESFTVRDSRGIDYKPSDFSIPYCEYNGLMTPETTLPAGATSAVGLLFDVDAAAVGLSLYLKGSDVAVDLGDTGQDS